MDDPRMVVRCLTCNLVQYQTKNQKCRRCNHSTEVKKFVIPEPETAEVLSPPIQEINPQVIFRVIKTSDIPRFFGLHLKSWREHRGLTQQSFVAKMRKVYRCNLSRSYLSRVESGQMNFSIGYISLALKCLEIAPSEFFNGYEKDWFIEGVAKVVSKVPISNRMLILKTIKSLVDKDRTYEHKDEVHNIVDTFGLSNLKLRNQGRRLVHPRDPWVETRIGV